MTRKTMGALFLACATAGVLPALCAAEEPATSKPMSSSSAPTPQTMTAEGAVSSVDLTSIPPSVQLTTADGKTWSMVLDAKTTSVWKGNQIATPEAVKTGDHVKVRYMAKDGKHWVKSIQIIEAMGGASSPATSMPMPSGSSESTKTPY